LYNILNIFVEYSYPSGDIVDIAFELEDENWSVNQGLKDITSGNIFSTEQIKNKLEQLRSSR